MPFAVLRKQNHNEQSRARRRICSASGDFSGIEQGKKRTVSSFAALFAGILLTSALAGCTTAGSGQSADNAALGAQLAPKQTGKAKRTNTKTSARAQAAAVAYTQHGYSRIGDASWYGGGFQGRRTANGEVFNKYNLTAAHRSMPLPSYARVTNMANGSSVIVRVNDRGPFTHNRLIDLSQGAAQLLGCRGTSQVKVDYVGPAPAQGHDEAFLRASYHPAGNAPLLQNQESTGKPLAYSSAAASVPQSGQKALSALTAKQPNKTTAGNTQKAHDDAAQPAKSNVQAQAGGDAAAKPVQLGFNMSQSEYDARVKKNSISKAARYQNPDTQNN